MYLLGIDLGSSSIKIALVDQHSNKVKQVVSHPEKEMEIMSPEPGWAEQDPEKWWSDFVEGTRKLLKKSQVKASEISGIGISYQMHGLVLVDKNQKVLRPSIIWCDSRAISLGEAAENSIGAEKCHLHLLNTPGNFTAAKLKWVKENEPDVFDKIDKIMLPGDFLAMKLNGKATTTISGLSEGMFWDFQQNQVADFLMEEMGFPQSIIPEIVPTFSDQGSITEETAELLGLSKNVKVGYRAGDQPNNALSLGVINPGEIAATGGTSGVVYGVQDQAVYDKLSRVNSFAHVNYNIDDPRIGVLLCINGTGILYRWVKNLMAKDHESYTDLESQLQKAAPGSDGITILPFGNGAERMLRNKDVGAHILNLQFNRHAHPQLYRAAIEGIAFAFIYGMEVLKELGLDIKSLKVGNDNLFQSRTFGETVSTLAGAPIEVINTTGAVGAARGAGFGIGIFGSLEEAVGSPEIVYSYQPNKELKPALELAYKRWKTDLLKFINN